MEIDKIVSIAMHIITMHQYIGIDTREIGNVYVEKKYEKMNSKRMYKLHVQIQRLFGFCTHCKCNLK